MNPFSKELMKLTPFQIVTDKVRENYTNAMLFELEDVFKKHRSDDESNRVSYKITRRGDLDVLIAMVLYESCGEDAVLVESTERYSMFTINVAEAQKHLHAKYSNEGEA